jgi:exopolyphosphatase / guanosine-5'-triphosphate,3'-diphosphate pyrophosphatase
MPSPSLPTVNPQAQPAAVIDIGTTSIRMAIADIDSLGGVKKLDALSQAVSLGRDTFTQGAITRSTIEECVRVLSSYRQILNEYQITRPEQIRVVATSAVREARNRLAFLDRIYIATGLEVQPLDEAEANRLTYLGIQPSLMTEPTLNNARAVVMEVGGGSTELLLVRDGKVIFANTYRLGSLRLRKMLEAFRTPQVKFRPIMENHIRRTLKQIREQIPESTTEGDIELIVMGGDVRFAATELIPDWKPSHLAELAADKLERFTDRILRLDEDDLVQRYHLTYPEAETVGPALLAYVMMARVFSRQRLFITNTNLRDGLLKEIALGNRWNSEFSNQIIRSAFDLARRYDVDQAHAQHVADLSQLLFDQLKEQHKLDPRHEVILYVAALLHEVGQFISIRSHHKHAMYVIRNSELFGLSRRDLNLVALTVRYHRRASPQPTHEGYTALDREDRVAVSKMAALLRVAVALDESRSQRIKELECRREDSQLVISVPGVDDLSLEQLAMRQSGSLFEEILGTSVQLRVKRYEVRTT